MILQKLAFCNAIPKDTLGKKATIYQLTTILSTSQNVLFAGPNYLLTIGADRWLSGNNQSVGSSAPVVSRCL